MRREVSLLVLLAAVPDCIQPKHCGVNDVRGAVVGAGLSGVLWERRPTGVAATTGVPWRLVAVRSGADLLQGLGLEVGKAVVIHSFHHPALSAIDAPSWTFPRSKPA